MKISKVFLLAFLFLVCSSSLSAQTDVNEIRKATEQAEKFLQTIREEKWDIVYSRIALVVRGRGKTTIKKIEELKKLDAEIQPEIIDLFKQYRTLDLKENLNIKIDKRDESIVIVEFASGKIEGFKMILINKEWFYVWEIFVD